MPPPRQRFRTLQRALSIFGGAFMAAGDAAVDAAAGVSCCHLPLLAAPSLQAPHSSSGEARSQAKRRKKAGTHERDDGEVRAHGLDQMPLANACLVAFV